MYEVPSYASWERSDQEHMLFKIVEGTLDLRPGLEQALAHLEHDLADVLARFHPGVRFGQTGATWARVAV